MVEDQSDGSRSKSRFDDRFSASEDYALKARKPYTITKQREKWTQDEHLRFLEALKLYGRSWRQIEEHVGNKTAVQIRSHAQKFFSKVVRESSGVVGAEGGGVEIPPPRAKRKSARPYPRKVSAPLKKGAGMVRSICHGSSRSDHENMSLSLLESVSTQSLKLFGKTVFVTGSTESKSNSVETVTTLSWNSLPTLAPEGPTTRSLSGYVDSVYQYQRSSDRAEPTTQCCSQEGKDGEFGKKGERYAKGFVPYKWCLAEESSSMLTYEEKEEQRVRLCL